MRVLLVEDDARVAAHIVKALGEAGHTVDLVTDGREGLYRVAGERYDAVVLDRMLPNVDGLTLLQTMRAAGNATPVLVLSALGDVDERVRGLRAGGDDYMAKPFAVSELLARLDALMRREATQAERHSLTVGDLTLDLTAREAQRAGRRIVLSPREFRLLEHMMRHENRVLTRSMLLDAAWDYAFEPQTNVIDQHISRLRQKIDGAVPGQPPLFHTVRGVGYVLRAPQSASGDVGGVK